jgi:AcrR family transcriptional regulator
VRATRQAILEAAQRLFERRGYPATTMEQVAAEAGVALKTVYLAFATKSGLLRALWDLRLKGDQAEAAVAERPWYREVVEERTPSASCGATPATPAWSRSASPAC